MKIKLTLLFIICLHTFQVHSLLDEQCGLMRDLLIVEDLDNRLNDRLPVTYNNQLQGGYINMPSARMGCDGEIGLGYTSVHPYALWNLRCQLTDYIEVTGNYRIFKGVADPVLSAEGFGDFSDKGANVKFSIFSPEDSDYRLPGLAFGFDDFLGTRAFKSSYVVLTQVFKSCNLEFTLGAGSDRIRGIFGGFNWFPFHHLKNRFLKPFCVTAEYDAIAYKSHKREPHPRGRTQKTPINIGLKYRLWDFIDLSAGYVRGEKLCCSLSAYYNFGYTKGFVPKVNEPLMYRTPIVNEPIGCRRPEDAVAYDYAYAFYEQGFRLLEGHLEYDFNKKSILRFRIANDRYRLEEQVRARINNIVAFLTPSNVDTVIVTMDTEGMPIQEYVYPMAFVGQFASGEMGPYELEVITPLQEASTPDPCSAIEIYKCHRDLCNFIVAPRTHTFFGSSKGKFKYSLGVGPGINGFLNDSVYYSVLLGYTLFSDLKHVGNVDRLNPSQLINVRTDSARYYKETGLVVDELYLQKNWALGTGWYARAGAGYFEQMYGGLISEVLYYPLDKNWAFGFQAGIFKKRRTTGLGFTNWITKYQGFVPKLRYFTGSQVFANFYYTWPEAKLDFKIQAGKFLANDWGARYEVSRYFPSGLILTMWYTTTNGHDNINGQTYYDKGIAFSMPIDVFYTSSSCARWGYGMSAWLRDVGASALTGQELYQMIREHREF
jgi:hypothetical protein